MNHNFGKKFKNITTPLHEDEKVSMWHTISTTVMSAQHEELRRKSLFSAFLYRPVILSLSVALFVVVSSVTVFASDNAKPGDLLFPIDRVAERMRLVLSSEEKRDELHLKFATERFEEVERFLALSITHQNTGTSTPPMATSTPPTDATSTPPMATSTPPMATSTPATDATSTPPDATSTPPTNDDDDDNSSGQERAFQFALEELMKSRERFVARGNETAVMMIDRMIARLQELSEGTHVHFDGVRFRVKHNEDIKVNIKGSDGDDDFKFKLDADGDGEKTKIKYDEKSDDGSKIKIDIKDKNGDSDDDDDDNGSGSHGSDGHDGEDGKDGEDGHGHDGDDGDDDSDNVGLGALEEIEAKVKKDRTDVKVKFDHRKFNFKLNSTDIDSVFSEVMSRFNLRRDEIEEVLEVDN